MYRAVALAAMQRDLSPAAVAPAIVIELGDRVTVDGVDVTAEIRTPEVSQAASVAASDPAVRAGDGRSAAAAARRRRLGRRGP